METHFYILKVKHESYRYDIVDGQIVEARNSSEARKIASEHCMDEGRETWLQPKYTSCQELKLTGKPRFVIRYSTNG